MLLTFQFCLWKRELEIMLTGMEKGCNKDIPLLVLCCSNGSINRIQASSRKIDCLIELSQRLGLDSISRPWAIFHVDIANMTGLEKALDWLLYRIQKRRIELEYHSYQGKNF